MSFKNHQNLIIEEIVTDNGVIQFMVTDPSWHCRIVSEYAATQVPIKTQQNIAQLPLSERQAFVNQYLVNRLESSSPYQVSMVKKEGMDVLVFGQYGLPAGVWTFERAISYAASTAQVLAGGALIATGAGALVGGALVSSGLSTMAHTAVTEDEDLTLDSYVTKGAIGGTVGLVTGGAGGLVSNVAAQAVVGGAAGQVTSKVLNTLDETGELPDAGDIAKSAALGAITGGLAKGASAAAGEMVGSVLSDASERVVSTVSGATSGAAAAGAATVASNAIEGRDLDEGLTESMLTGAAVGGAIGAMRPTSDSAERSSKSKSDKQQLKSGEKPTDPSDKSAKQPKPRPVSEQEFKKAEDKLVAAGAAKTDAQTQMNEIQNTVNDAAKNGFKFKYNGKYISAEQAIQKLAEGHTVKFSGAKTVAGRIAARARRNGPQRGKYKFDPVNQQASADYKQAQQDLADLRAQNAKAAKLSPETSSLKAEKIKSKAARASSSSQHPPQSAIVEDILIVEAGDFPQEAHAHDAAAGGADAGAAPAGGAAPNPDAIPGGVEINDVIVVQAMRHLQHQFAQGMEAHQQRRQLASDRKQLSRQQALFNPQRRQQAVAIRKAAAQTQLEQAQTWQTNLDAWLVQAQAVRLQAEELAMMDVVVTLEEIVGHIEESQLLAQREIAKLGTEIQRCDRITALAENESARVAELLQQQPAEPSARGLLFFNHARDGEVDAIEQAVEEMEVEPVSADLLMGFYGALARLNENMVEPYPELLGQVLLAINSQYFARVRDDIAEHSQELHDYLETKFRF